MSVEEWKRGGWACVYSHRCCSPEEASLGVLCVFIRECVCVWECTLSISTLKGRLWQNLINILHSMHEEPDVRSFYHWGGEGSGVPPDLQKSMFSDRSWLVFLGNKLQEHTFLIFTMNYFLTRVLFSSLWLAVIGWGEWTPHTNGVESHTVTWAGFLSFPSFLIINLPFVLGFTR